MVRVYNDSSKFYNYLPIFGTKNFLSTKSKEYGWFKDDNFIMPFYIDRRFIFSKLVFTTETLVIN